MKNNVKVKSIKQIKSLKNKTVLVRCDFDVPLKRQTTNDKRQIKNKKKLLVVSRKLLVVDDSRLRAAVPTIKYLLSKGAKVILMGHLGRPDGKVVSEMSLLPVKNHLEGLLKKKIVFVAGGLKKTDHQIVMLENLRFNKGEEKNDINFAKKLASLADIYVNESFAVSHRAAASVNAIQNYLPSYAGLQLEKEVINLSTVLAKPTKPLVVIIGGAKIETKLPLIKQFVKKADYILVGGGVANTFLKAAGVDIKKSLVDNNYVGEAEKIIKTLKHKNIKTKIILPTDYIWSNERILDVGPQTIKQFCAIIKSAKTMVWNGPLGYFEDKRFAVGTQKIIKALINSKAHIIVGGGETGEVFNQAIKRNKKEIRKNIFMSTGGGAMLEFLGGKQMPGLKKIIK